MTIRHINPNMILFVQVGIALADELASVPSPEPGRTTFVEQRDIIETETPAMARHTGRFLPAKRIAFAEGFIAAYRSAELPSRCRSGHTDCTVDCGWCKGTGIQGGRP